MNHKHKILYNNHQDKLSIPIKDRKCFLLPALPDNIIPIKHDNWFLQPDNIIQLKGHK